MFLDLQEKDLQLESGKLCLDFANTADWHASAHPVEELTTYKDLVNWANRVGLLDERQAERLLSEASNRSGEAQAALEKAVALREAIYVIFSANAQGLPTHPEGLETINAAASEAFAHLLIINQGEGFQWKLTGTRDRLDCMLWPVAISAGELLTSEEKNRVGECADDRGCGWLFFDTSRNRSRRWCDMKDCGNRAKARRYYQRVKGD